MCFNICLVNIDICSYVTKLFAYIYCKYLKTRIFACCARRRLFPITAKSFRTLQMHGPEGVWSVFKTNCRSCKIALTQLWAWTINTKNACKDMQKQTKMCQIFSVAEQIWGRSTLSPFFANLWCEQWTFLSWFLIYPLKMLE